MIRYFLSLGIGSKLMLAFLLLIAGCGATLYQGFLTLDRFQSELDSTSRRFDRISDIKELKANMAVQNQLVLKTIIQKAAAQGADIQNIEDLQQKNTALLHHLQQGQGNKDEVKALISAIQNARTEHLHFFQTNVLPSIKAEQYDQSWLLMSEHGTELTSNIEKKTDELERLTVQLMQQSLEETGQEFAALKQRLVFFSLLMVGIGVLLSWLLSRHIALPLASLAIMAEQIGRGEIPKEVPHNVRRDEVGRLSLAFATMSKYLRELVQELNESTSVLATSGEEILAVTNQVATSTQETATAISEITTTVQEVKQTATISGAKSQEVMDSAETTKQEVQSGRVAVEETLLGMDQIREQMQAVADSIVRLGEQSQAIGEIVASVGDLAEQSNLLGVNASIEAVKAGEAGKGFSVVAQEVKALAEQSKQATTQVRTILGDIQRAMTKAVLLAEQSSKTVERGYQRAQQTGEAIQALSNRIDESSGAAMQIAASSQQQKIGMDQIAIAMENIRQASQDNVVGARQVDLAAKNLNQLGLKLKQLTMKFTL